MFRLPGREIRSDFGLGLRRQFGLTKEEVEVWKAAERARLGEGPAGSCRRELDSRMERKSHQADVGLRVGVKYLLELLFRIGAESGKDGGEFFEAPLAAPFRQPTPA